MRDNETSASSVVAIAARQDVTFSDCVRAGLDREYLVEYRPAKIVLGKPVDQVLRVSWLVNGRSNGVLPLPRFRTQKCSGTLMGRLFGRKNGRQLWAPTTDPRLETSVLAHVCYATKEREQESALSTFPMSLGLWDLLQIAPAQGMLAVPRWNPHALIR